MPFHKTGFASMLIGYDGPVASAISRNVGVMSSSLIDLTTKFNTSAWSLVSISDGPFFFDKINNQLFVRQNATMILQREMQQQVFLRM